MHRDDLHRCCVCLQSPAALLPALACRFVPSPTEPGEQRGEAELALQRGLMQPLGDVAEIGEQPFTVRLSQDSSLHGLLKRHGLEQRRHTSGFEDPPPHA